MFTTNPDTPDPQAYFAELDDRADPQQGQQLGVQQLPRATRAPTTTSWWRSRGRDGPGQAQARSSSRQQQLLFNDAVYIGLVARKGPFGYTTGMEGFQPTASRLTWNIANWVKK